MKSYVPPKMELQIIDAQDIVCASGGAQPTNGVVVGDGGKDINNWYFDI